MISKNKFKESLSIDLKYGAFYSGGKVSWSKDGATMYCPNSGCISIVDLELGRPKLILGDQNEDNDFIYCFAVFADGSRLISSHKSGLFKSWKLPDGTLIKQWKSIHKGPVAELDIEENGELLASGGSDSVIRIWNLVHHSCTHALRGALGVISVVKILQLKNKNVVFGCGDDLKITGWDLKSSEIFFQLTGHYSKVTSISLFEDGQHLASCARDNVIMLWDLESKSCIKTFPVFESLEDIVVLPNKFELLSIGEIQKGFYVASAGEKGIIRIFDMMTGKELYKQSNSLVTEASEKGGLCVTQLLYNSLKNCFAVVTVDHNIIFYKLDNFECVKQMVGFSDEILDIVYVGKENSHVAVATNSCDIKIYNVKNMGCQLLKGHTDFVLTLTSSFVNKNWMLSGAKDNSIRLWEMIFPEQKMICLASASRHTASVTGLCMSQMTNNFFLSTSQDTTLKLWTIKSLKVKEGNDDVDCKLSVKNSEVAHQKEINTVVVSPNDKLIATGSQDKTAKLWHAENLSYIGSLIGHRRGVWCVRFSPIDQIILSSSADSTIKIWSVADLSCLKTFEGHSSSVLRAEFITKGIQIITASGDGMVKLWNVKSGECVGTFNEHDGRIWAMAVSSDENQLITGGSDSLLIIWHDSTQEKKEIALKAQEEIILNEQRLSNLINSNNLFDALGLALSLEKPYKVLSIIKDLMKLNKKDDLKSSLKKLTTFDKERLLECCTVWNSNSKNCDAAQLVMSILLEEIAFGELKISRLSSFVEETLPYTERHFKRLTKILEDLHFLHYTMAVMKPELNAIAFYKAMMEYPLGKDPVVVPERSGSISLDIPGILENIILFPCDFEECAG